jgi:hypothetical protein
VNDTAQNMAETRKFLLAVFYSLVVVNSFNVVHRVASGPMRAVPTRRELVREHLDDQALSAFIGCPWRYIRGGLSPAF